MMVGDGTPAFRNPAQSAAEQAARTRLVELVEALPQSRAD